MPQALLFKVDPRVPPFNSELYRRAQKLKQKCVAARTSASLLNEKFIDTAYVIYRRRRRR